MKTREVGTSDIISGERIETELESVAENSDHLKDTTMESGGEETLDDDLSKEADVGNKEKENKVYIRASLPRSSKEKHKILANSSVQKAKDSVQFSLNKKSLKKNH